MELRDAEKCMELLKPLKYYEILNLNSMSADDVSSIILTIVNDSKNISVFLKHVNLLFNHGLYSNKQMKKIKHNLNIIIRNDYFNLAGKYIFNYILGYVAMFMGVNMYAKYQDIYPTHTIEVYFIGILKQYDTEASLVTIYKDILESIDFDYMNIEYREYVDDSILNVKIEINKFIDDLMLSSDITICKILNNHNNSYIKSNILNYFSKLYNFNLEEYLTPKIYRLYVIYKSHQYYNYFIKMFVKVKFDEFIDNLLRINYNEFNFDIMMESAKVKVNVYNDILTIEMGEKIKRFRIYMEINFIKTIISYIHDNIEEMYE